VQKLETDMAGDSFSEKEEQDRQTRKMNKKKAVLLKTKATLLSNGKPVSCMMRRPTDRYSIRHSTCFEGGNR
jgi:hypothetical protein